MPALDPPITTAIEKESKTNECPPPLPPPHPIPNPAHTQAKDQLRYNLLKIPALRRLLRSSLWPEDINFKWAGLGGGPRWCAGLPRMGSAGAQLYGQHARPAGLAL